MYPKRLAYAKNRPVNPQKSPSYCLQGLLLKINHQKSSTYPQKSPVNFHKSPIHPQNSLTCPNKGPTFSKKSPIYSRKSRTYPQKSPSYCLEGFCSRSTPNAHTCTHGKDTHIHTHAHVHMHFLCLFLSFCLSLSLSPTHTHTCVHTQIRSLYHRKKRYLCFAT